MIDLETMTGPQIKVLCKANKISMRVLYEACEFPNSKSHARIMNIVNKDSWKEGDRERVTRALGLVLPGVYVLPDELRDGYAPPAPEPAGTSDVETVTDEDEFDAVATLTSNAEPEVPDVSDLSVTVEGPVSAEALEAYEDPAPALTPAFASDAYHLSNSEVQAYKRCPRRWWLSWYLRLALRDEDKLNVRGTGTRIHRALEAFYVPEGQTSVDPRAALERVLVEDWTAIKQAAEARGHDDFVLADLSDRFQKTADLERAMVEGYVQWIEETGADANLRVTASETTLDVPLTDGVNLVGKLDVRATRTSDGARLFLDHKTVGSFSASIKTLPMNEQMLHYMVLEYLYAVCEEVRARTSQVTVHREVDVPGTQPTEAVVMSLLREVDFDFSGSGRVDRSSSGRESSEQRSGESRPVALGMPQFTPQQGSEEGSVYRGSPTSTERIGEGEIAASLDRSVKEEAFRIAEESVAAAKAKVSNGALYNMLRRVKRTAAAKPPFYERVEVRHNQYELDAYRRELVAVSDDIQRTIGRLEADPNTVLPANRTGACSWDCDFFAVCTMFDDGSRVGDAVRALYVQGDPLARYERKGNE